MLSSGVYLVEDQQNKYNATLSGYGVGVAATFVHCLFRTDIEHNYLVSFHDIPNIPPFFLFCFYSS